MINRFISWLYTRRMWGVRCIDYDPGCACCEAWATHDWLFNGAPDPNFVAHLSRLADGVEAGEIKTVKLTETNDGQLLKKLLKDYQPKTDKKTLRVAKALCAAGFHEWPLTDGTGSDYNNHQEQRYWLRLAEAAIKEIDD